MDYLWTGRGSAASPSGHPSRFPMHNVEGCLCGSPSAPATPAPCPRSLASFSAGSASAPCAPASRQSQCSSCPYRKHTPFLKYLVYVSASADAFETAFTLSPRKARQSESLDDSQNHSSMAVLGIGVSGRRIFYVPELLPLDLSVAG